MHHTCLAIYPKNQRRKLAPKYKVLCYVYGRIYKPYLEDHASHPLEGHQFLLQPLLLMLPETSFTTWE